MKGFSQRFAAFKTQASAYLDGLNNGNNGGGNDDTASEVSDMSYATIDSRAALSYMGGMIASFTETVPDEEIDNAMRNLYEDPDLLEKRCKLSAMGRSFSEEEKPETFSSLANSPRLSVTKTVEDVVTELPPEYFTEEYDPVEPYIDEVQHWDDLEMVENFMIRLEDADSNKDFIMGRLADKIEENFDQLMTIVRDGKDIDTDISSITFQLKKSRRDIGSATTIYTEGGMKISRLNRRKEKLFLVQESIQSLKEIKDLHRAMRQFTNTGDLGRAAECACSVLQCLQDKISKNDLRSSSDSGGTTTDESVTTTGSNANSTSPCMFKALEHVSQDTQMNLQNIRYKADKALGRICTRKFAPAEYANVMQAYVVIDYLHDMTGLMTKETKSEDDDDEEEEMEVEEEKPEAVAGGGEEVETAEGVDGAAPVEDKTNPFDEADGDAEKGEESVSEKPDTADSNPFDEADDPARTSATSPTAPSTPAAQPAPAPAPSGPVYAGCIDNLAKRIQKSLLEDIDACLNNAALEFIFASQHKKQQAAAALAIEGMASTIAAVDMFDLAELELDELYQRASPDLVAPIVVRSCELLADIVHTHFMISQWHSAPFDPRNEDVQFIHRSVPLQLQPDNDGLRSGITSQETSISGDSKPQGKSDTSVIKSESEIDISAAIAQALTADESQLTTIPSEDRPAWKSIHSGDSLSEQLQKLGVAHLSSYALTKILGSRPKIWSQVEAAVVRMLNDVNVTASINAEDVLAITWAVNAIIGLGREFGNSGGQSITTALHMFHRDYFQRVHHETFNVIRQMVESEPWRCIPVNLASMGGIMGVIKMNIAKSSESSWGLRGMVGLSLGLSFNYLTFNEALPISSNATSPMGSPSPGTPRCLSPGKSPARKSIKPESMLKVFAAHGNPLHFMTEGQAASSDGADEQNQAILEASSSKKSNDMDSQKTFLAMLLDDEDVTRSTKKAKDLASSLVVTQTSLNGLARYAGRYMQIMHLMPSVSPDILNGLFRLFDYYLCSTFVGFVSADERQKVLSKPTKTTMPPPDQSKDFEALQQYMERTLNETVQMDVPAPLRKALSVEAAAVADNTSSTPATPQAPNQSGTAQATPTAPGTLATSVSSNDLHSEGTASPRSDAPASSSKKDFMRNMSMGLKNFNESVVNAVQSTSAAISQGKVKKVSALLRTPMSVEENDPTSFYALHERIAGAESCWFASSILTEVKNKLLKLLPDQYESGCDGYIRHYQFICGQLRGLIYRSTCPILIKSNYVSIFSSSYHAQYII
jgi:hypothetical protein